MIDHRDEKNSVLGRPGSDLLFQALRLSTIGAEEFNGRVRDGNGFRLLARTTRSAKDGFASASGASVPDLIRDPEPQAEGLSSVSSISGVSRDGHGK